MRKTGDVLIELGITPDIRGFQCICEALKEIDVAHVCKLTKTYADVGKGMELTSASVERAIRTTIDLRLDENSQAYKKYVAVPKNELTNGKFLYMLKYTMEAEDEENGDDN